MNWSNSAMRLGVTATALWVAAMGTPCAGKAGPDDAAATAVATSSPAVKRLDVPIPVNRGARGLRIPSRDASGKVRMFFNIDTAFRVDDGHLRMTSLRIVTYDDDGKPDLNIDMPLSHLDLKTNLISSIQPVTIHRSDFEVTGGNMTFDPQTRLGKFSGPVRMLIFNHDVLDKKPAPKTETAANPQGAQP